MSAYKVNVSNSMSRNTVIVTGETTLRDIFGEAGIEIGLGTVSLDAATIMPGDLDKGIGTFDLDEEITHSLASSPKRENAAKAVVTGGAIVVSSIATPEELRTIKKYRPDALKLVDKETKNVQYLVSIAGGLGELNGNGAIFGQHADGEGKATITIGAPDDVSDVRDWAIEHLGSALLKLNKVEEQFTEQLESIAADRAAVEASIVVG